MTHNTQTRDLAIIEPMYDVAQEAWQAVPQICNNVFARATSTSGTFYRFYTRETTQTSCDVPTGEHEFYFAPFAVLKDVAMLSQYAEMTDIVETLTHPATEDLEDLEDLEDYNSNGGYTNDYAYVDRVDDYAALNNVSYDMPENCRSGY